ncbi:MAG: CCA tRNA nucleotidyltransferase [Chloroflexi bacterium]|nr:CCA tRNA nucleotidyltransferase [Chloroflexota bacterium]
MLDPADIASRLHASLTGEQVHILARAVFYAEAAGLPLYLVGGGVRDILMGAPLKDFDLAAEGDPSAFAPALALDLGSRIEMRSQFATTKFTSGGMNVDVAMARRETYARPGALPAVAPASIAEDLWRRDFTIHAIALRLHPAPMEIRDPTGGLRDLEAGLVRVLHPRSFQDDATRILRALRYEQRLGFRLEAETERLLLRDRSYLDAISGDRLRRELDLAFHEPCAPGFLRRAAGLGVLQALHPDLPDAPAINQRLDELPRLGSPPLPLTHLALLTFGLQESRRKAVLARFNATKAWAKVVEDAAAAEAVAAALTPALRPSEVCRKLQGLAIEAIQSAAALCASHDVRALLLRYLSQWRHMRPHLAGGDLLRLGIPPGPHLGDILEALQDAVWDGAVKTREEEMALVRRISQVQAGDP